MRQRAARRKAERLRLKRRTKKQRQKDAAAEKARKAAEAAGRRWAKAEARRARKEAEEAASEEVRRRAELAKREVAKLKRVAAKQRGEWRRTERAKRTERWEVARRNAPDSEVVRPVWEGYSDGGCCGPAATPTAGPRKRERDSVATEGAHGRKRRLTIAVASGSNAAVRCVLARDQRHGEVLCTAQGAVPLLDEDSDASEDGVT